MTSHSFKQTISKEALAELPSEELRTPVYLIDHTTTPERIEEVMTEIGTCKIVGFDTETKPSFKKGVRHQVCLMQIALPDKIFVFRLHLIKKIIDLQQLFEYLERTSPIKVGVGIYEDICELKRDYNVSVQNVCDLRKLAKEASIEVESLSKIYACIYDHRLSKAQRVSDWEKQQLSEAQITYAALDAMAGLKIFDALKEFYNKKLLQSTPEKLPLSAREKQKKRRGRKKIPVSSVSKHLIRHKK